MDMQFFDTMIVASSDKSGCNDLSKYKCWKLFRATLKHSSSAFLSGCSFGLTGKRIKPELNALSRMVQAGSASRQLILNSPMDLPSILTPTSCIGAMQALIRLVG